MSAVEIGISGWNYEGWRGTFYPPELPARKELSFASRELPSIEINGTFYSLQRPSSYKRWYEETPPDFIFSIKANRYITHVKRLKDVEIPMANFFASGTLALEEKLGPFLWQFPPNMRFEPKRFINFLKLLPKNFKEAKKLINKSDLSEEKIYSDVKKNFKMRHAIEVRNESFLNPWFIEMLREQNVALVFADTAQKWPYMEDITADFIYVRLHGDSQIYESGYEDEALNFWVKRIRKWKSGKEASDRLTITEDYAENIERDIYIYFDNDAKVRAPADAKSLMIKLKGLR